MSETIETLITEPKQYLWEKEIKSIQWNVVTDIDWKDTTLTDKQLTYMVTTEPKSLTEARDILLDNIVPEVMDVLEAHNIRKWDLSSIIDTVINSYNMTFFTAIGKAFWTYEKGKPHLYFQDDIRVSDMTRLIKQ